MDALKEYKKWLDCKYLTIDEKHSLESLDEYEIQDRFNKTVSFGTGGLREKMGLGTNRLNIFVIKKATSGLAKYLLNNEKYLEEKDCEKSVVIAYDNRLNSKEFCDIAAKTLASFGIKTYIYNSLRSTPQLSFSVQYLRCMAGIMITASHNPKEYNGYKVYSYTGAQIINKETKEIKEFIDSVDDYLDLNIKYNANLINVLDGLIDEEFYKNELNSTLSNDLLDDVKIVYSPSHGTGYIPVTTVLRKKKVNLIEVKEQSYPSTSFENTKCPNPEDKRSYEVGLKYFIDNKADALIVTDPDCDRIGVCLMNKNEPLYISGNYMGLLLTNYILQYKKINNLLKEDSTVVSTKVSSCLIKKLVESYEVKYSEVYTGFKNIAHEILHSNITYEFGFEESYGYLYNTFVKDKDAVQISLLIAEMIHFYKKMNKNIVGVLDEILDKFGYSTESQINIFLEGQNGIENKEKLINKAYSFDEDFIKGHKVKNVEKVYPESGETLVKIILDDDSFIAIRPSGTEPKIKIYLSILGDKYQDIKEFVNNYFSI